MRTARELAAGAIDRLVAGMAGPAQPAGDAPLEAGRVDRGRLSDLLLDVLREAVDRPATASPEAKMLDQASLLDRISRLRDSGLVDTVVFTNGCFDILHVGHVRTLRFSRSQGDLLVVGLNSDRSVRALKGEGRPVLPETQRAEMLASLQSVSHVVVFDEDTPEDLIRRLRPDVLVKGADWAGKRVAGSEYARRVALAPVTVRVSSSGIVSKIKSAP